MGIWHTNFEMFRLAFLHPYQRMCVEYVDSDSGERKKLESYAVAAVRVTNFPGLMGRFAPGAELVRDDLRLVFTLTTNRLWHAAYFMRILAGQERAGARDSAGTRERGHVYAGESKSKAHLHRS